MADNPTRFSFRMPTERVDGSQIDGVLAANVYIDGEVIAAYPSALNPGGTGEMLFEDLAWAPTAGQTHVLTLTAQEGEMESAPSVGVEFRFFGQPLPPAILAVE